VTLCVLYRRRWAVRVPGGFVGQVSESTSDHQHE
jgi:hypothetical protein